MPAQAQHHVMSAYLSATTDDIDVGDVLIPDANNEFYIKATLANRTAAARTTTAAGVALTPGSSDNRAVEIQTVGPCPQTVTGLSTGTATTLRVSDAGRLERGAPGIAAGNCDADGFAYLNFTGTSGGGGGGGAPEDATYVTLSTNGTLTNERVLTGGTGITVTDAGAGSTVTVAAPGMAAPFITQALSGDLANERVLTAGAGITLTDGGAGSTMTVAAPAVAAQYVTLATSADLANERVLTAGTEISITDNGPGGTVVINNTQQTAPIAAQYVVLATHAGLSSERVLTAGTNISIVDGGAGGNVTINASGGATPGGSDNEGQYNNGGAFGGMSGLVYDEATNRPQLVNGWYLSSGANRFLFTGTPAGARTITFQDATHTVVGRDTTDTLTNKAINVSSNTLTDTSIAQYDLLLANATPVFRRFAKGSNSRVLTTSSGGVVQWDQVQTAMIGGGSNGNFLCWQSGAASWNNVAAYYGYQTSPATDGFLRGSNAVNDHTARNAAGSADVTLIMLGTDDNLYIGSNASDAERATGNRYNTAGYHYFSVAGSFYVVMQSSAVQMRQSLEVGVNLAGCSALNAPLVLKKASVTVSGSTDVTLTAAQYSCPFIYCSGSVSGTPNVLAPATEGAFFVVSNDCNGTIRFGDSAGAGVTVASEVMSILIGNQTTSSDYSKPA